jgi:hypothetical protein
MNNWKDIEGYEGLYQVNNQGQVKSLKRERICKNGSVKIYHEKFLNGFVNNIGYLCFDLYNDSGRKNIKAHFLVASNFCEGYSSGLVVNHKDGNKVNNHYSNLEWITQKENAIHAFKNRIHIIYGFTVIHIQTGIFFESMGDAFRSGLVLCSLSHFKKQLNGSKENKTDFLVI